MADFPDVEIKGDSPEAVAYALLLLRLRAETDQGSKGKGGRATPSGDWILKTYAECLRVVRSGQAPDDEPAAAEGAGAEPEPAQTATSDEPSAG